MNKKRIKKLLIIVLLIIECISINSTVTSFKNKKVDNIKEEYVVERKNFAVFIDDGNGAGFVEYNGNIFPSGYILNKDMSKCVDMYNKAIENVLSYSNGKLTIDSDKTLYCNLYLEAQIPIFAIFSEEEGGSLTFYQNYDEVEVDTYYDGIYVTNVYKGLENTNYTSVSDVPWREAFEYGIELNFADEIKPTNTAYWFANVELYSQDFTNLNTENVTDMSYMFANFFGGDNIIPNFNTSNVTNMEGMFMNVYFDTYFNFVNWDTSKVENMSYMFKGASGAEGGPLNVNLIQWNTGSVKDMSHMFENAGSSEGVNLVNLNGLDTVGLSLWDTSNVTDMSYMFSFAAADNGGEDCSWVENCDPAEEDCECEEYLEVYGSGTFKIGDISGWDTSNVENMNYMFYYAGYEANYELDLSSWNVGLEVHHINFNTGVENQISKPW